MRAVDAPARAFCWARPLPRLPSTLTALAPTAVAREWPRPKAQQRITTDRGLLRELGGTKEQNKRRHVVAQRGPETGMADEGLPCAFRNVRGHL